MTQALTKFNPVHCIVHSDKVQATECGMVIVDPDMSFDEAEGIINELRNFRHALSRGDTCVQVCDGDMMLFVEERFPDTWPQMFDAEDWKRRRNHKYVAHKVPIERRRPESQVTFDHYRYVAPLCPSDQEHYLQMVVDKGLSTRALYRQIDEDLIDRLLDERDEDNEFWRYYQEKMNLMYAGLVRAIERGREAAEEELKGMERNTFKSWCDWYMEQPDFHTKTIEENMEDAYNAGGE